VCGRYSLTKDDRRFREKFADPEQLALRPRYNIAPSQDGPVVFAEGEAQLRMMRWGLIPSWSRDMSVGNKLVNARGESVAERPSFRESFLRRRCLVLADGFYEWRKLGRTRWPVRIRLKTDGTFAMAGLWDRWTAPDGELIESFCIITTSANSLLASVHDRMPVILREEDYARWLDPGMSAPEQLLPLLRPYPPEEMELYPVNPIVNKPDNDGPECIQRWDESPQTSQPEACQTEWEF
jgi:putative SOS response-associated peptidase YedK